jgi:hypothetical protein
MFSSVCEDVESVKTTRGIKNIPKVKTGTKFWKFAFWILLPGWITGAVLFMARFHGGFLTDYLADLTFPPWFYIYVRGLPTDKNKIPRLLIFGKWFGASPERASVSIFLVGLVSELMTRYWPKGPITGTYDVIDILFYAAGLLLCYYLDRFHFRRG